MHRGTIDSTTKWEKLCLLLYMDAVGADMCGQPITVLLTTYIALLFMLLLDRPVLNWVIGLNYIFHEFQAVFLLNFKKRKSTSGGNCLLKKLRGLNIPHVNRSSKETEYPSYVGRFFITEVKGGHGLISGSCYLTSIRSTTSVNMCIFRGLGAVYTGQSRGFW